MGYPCQGHMAILVTAVGVVVPDRTSFTVGANEILHPFDSVGKADVVEVEHVTHHPELFQLWR